MDLRELRLSLIVSALLIAAIVGLGYLVQPFSAALRSGPAPARATVFKNVRIVDTASGKVLHGQTVVVRDGRVETVGEGDEVEFLATDKVIKGRGHYLLHLELDAFKDADLSGVEMLKVATAADPSFMKELNDFGTVEVGQSADLVLFKRNPVKRSPRKRAKNLARRSGVMMDGQWLPGRRVSNRRRGNEPLGESPTP